MKTFNDLEFKSSGLGVRALLYFANKYGVSVIKNPFSYGSSEGLFEMAVMDEITQSIEYTTHITDDVLGHLTPEDVTKHMKEVQLLKR